MDSVFDRMFDIIEHEELESPECVNEIIASENEVRNLHPPVETEVVDQREDVLDPAVRERFKNETIFHETRIFTKPTSTTNTMDGYISNVNFHESAFIHELMADENIVIYKCNFGFVKYEKYTVPVRVKKTNRGRKNKEKKKKNRKKQGLGTDFNSQITAIVRSRTVNVGDDGTVPYGARVYKFKVFRPGQIQLPGVLQHSVDDVIECANEIVRVMNFHLHHDERDPEKLSSLKYMSPVMKNYKFLVKMPARHIIDLHAFKIILLQELAAQHGEVLDYPPIFMVKYTRQETKLSVKFSTPMYKNPDKKTRINFFMRGKVNILGAYNNVDTQKICTYLHQLFDLYYDDIIVPEGVV